MNINKFAVEECLEKRACRDVITLTMSPSYSSLRSQDELFGQFCNVDSNKSGGCMPQNLESNGVCFYRIIHTPEY